LGIEGSRGGKSPKVTLLGQKARLFTLEPLRCPSSAPEAVWGAVRRSSAWVGGVVGEAG
jgi:hypothetical protein